MLNYIWGFIVLISIICAFFTGRISEISSAALDGAKSSVELIISMLGMMCLWSGLMNIAERGGLTAILARVLSPVLKNLFPEYKNNTEVRNAICSNMAANFLGIGNAATPLGINAMRLMEQANPIKGTANKSMIRFVVINTASIQLIPTFVAVLRQTYGSASPMDILPGIWASSVFGLLAGLIFVKIHELTPGPSPNQPFSRTRFSECTTRRKHDT